MHGNCKLSMDGKLKLSRMATAIVHGGNCKLSMDGNCKLSMDGNYKLSIDGNCSCYGMATAVVNYAPSANSLSATSLFMD